MNEVQDPLLPEGMELPKTEQPTQELSSDVTKQLLIEEIADSFKDNFIERRNCTFPEYLLAAISPKVENGCANPLTAASRISDKDIVEHEIHKAALTKYMELTSGGDSHEHGEEPHKCMSGEEANEIIIADLKEVKTQIEDLCKDQPAGECFHQENSHDGVKDLLSSLNNPLSSP